MWPIVVHYVWAAYVRMDRGVWDRQRVQWRGWCPANEMEYFERRYG